MMIAALGPLVEQLDGRRNTRERRTGRLPIDCQSSGQEQIREARMSQAHSGSWVIDDLLK
jgi:hypothetical protein